MAPVWITRTPLSGQVRPKAESRAVTEDKAATAPLRGGDIAGSRAAAVTEPGPLQTRPPAV